MNVAFANGWIVEEPNEPYGEADRMNGVNKEMVNDKLVNKNDTRRVFIYYASADTRLHVATTTVAQLLDYCLHTPEDGLTTTASVETIKALVAKNKTCPAAKQ